MKKLLSTYYLEASVFAAFTGAVTFATYALHISL